MRVLVTGAGGFIGSAVVRILRSRPGALVIAAHHRPRPGGTHVELRDPSTLACVADADVIVHAAHAVSGDRAHLQETNVQGTRHLLAAARSDARIVSVSTASVYGPGPWRGEDVQSLAEAPGSPVSRSRAEADNVVLTHGGTVVRPHLVHGPRDRWFVPRARQVLAQSGWFDGEAALHSTIHVDDLARRVAELALSADLRPGIRLASDPPRTMPEVLSPYLAPGFVPPHETSRAEAIAHPAAAGDHRWAHDVDLLAIDHFLSDSRAAS